MYVFGLKNAAQEGKCALVLIFFAVLISALLCINDIVYLL